MKKKWKKLLVGVLAGILAALTLTGCGNRNNAADEAAKEAVKQGVYRVESLNVFGLEEGQDAYPNIYSVDYVDGKLKILATIETYSETEEGYSEWNSEVQLITCNLDGSDRQVVVVPEEGMEGYCNGMAMTESMLYRVYSLDNYDEEGNYSQTIEMVGSNLNMEEIFRVNVKPENMAEGDWFYISQFLGLSNDRVVLSSGSTLAVYDATGAVVQNIPWDNNSGSINAMSETEEGNLRLTHWNSDYSSISITEVNLQTGAIGESEELGFSPNNYTMRASKNHDLLLTNSAGLYYYDQGMEAPALIMNFINSDFSSSGLDYIVEVDDEHFLAFYYDYTLGNQIMGSFAYVKPEDIQDKEVLTLATYYMNYELRNRVLEFNKTNEKYRIAMNDYSQYATNDDYMAGYTQLNNEIISGNMPDILVLDENIPVNSYIAKGLLADVNTFLEEDPELNVEDYFENVFNAFSVDGKLYSVIPSFSVWTVVGKTENVGEEPGWTMQEMQALLASKPEGTNLFSMDMTRDNIMWYVMMMALPQYIDTQTGTCSFDSQEFKDLLAFLKDFPVSAELDYSDPNFWTEYETQYLTGKALLSTTSLYSAEDLIYMRGNFGGEVTLIGFPREEGVGAVIQSYTRYGISAKTANKEGVWEFLRYYFTDEYQETQGGTSINKDIWMEYNMQATKIPSWEDEEGNVYEEPYSSWISGEQVILDPLTEAEVQEYFEYISSVDLAYYTDQSLEDIINEEAAPYFEGQKTVDEVVSIIQNRAQLYLDETR